MQLIQKNTFKIQHFAAASPPTSREKKHLNVMSSVLLSFVHQAAAVMPVHVAVGGASAASQVPAHLTRIPISLVSTDTDCSDKTVQVCVPRLLVCVAWDTLSAMSLCILMFFFFLPGAILNKSLFVMACLFK